MISSSSTAALALGSHRTSSSRSRSVEYTELRSTLSAGWHTISVIPVGRPERTLIRLSKLTPSAWVVPGYDWP